MIDRQAIDKAEKLERSARELIHRAALIRHEASTPAITYEQVMLTMLENNNG